MEMMNHCAGMKLNTFKAGVRSTIWCSTWTGWKKGSSTPRSFNLSTLLSASAANFSCAMTYVQQSDNNVELKLLD